MYHWPLQQLMVLTIAFTLPTWAFVVVSLVLSVPMALRSWKLVEKPALARRTGCRRGHERADTGPRLGSWGLRPPRPQPQS